MLPLPRIAVGLLPLFLMACGAASPPSERAPTVAGPRLTNLTLRGDSLPAAAMATGTVRRATRLFAGGAAVEDTAPRTLAPATTSASQSAPRDPGRLIVRSAYLRIERSDPEAGVKAASQIARRLGGWVQQSDNTSATLMVPAGHLDAALDEIAKLGKVARKDVRGEDVTEEYLDVRIRLDNLERSRQRYLALLSQAQNVTETLAVERELERITGQIERLKGRLAYLGRVVRNSTIRVSFRRHVGPGPIGWVFYILYHGIKWLFVWD